MSLTNAPIIQRIPTFLFAPTKEFFHVVRLRCWGLIHLLTIIKDVHFNCIRLTQSGWLRRRDKIYLYSKRSLRPIERRQRSLKKHSTPILRSTWRSQNLMRSTMKMKTRWKIKTSQSQVLKKRKMKWRLQRRLLKNRLARTLMRMSFKSPKQSLSWPSKAQKLQHPPSLNQPFLSHERRWREETLPTWTTVMTPCPSDPYAKRN